MASKEAEEYYNNNFQVEFLIGEGYRHTEIVKAFDAGSEWIIQNQTLNDMQLAFVKTINDKLISIHRICDMVLDGTTNYDEEQLEEFIKQIDSIAKSASQTSSEELNDNH